MAAMAATLGPCGLCGVDVGGGEQHIRATCTVCGEVSYHTDCVAKHMKALMWPRLRATVHWEKREQQLLRRPHDLFARNGRVQKLHVTCPKCKSGINQSAEVVRPPRDHARRDHASRDHAPRDHAPSRKPAATASGKAAAMAPRPAPARPPRQYFYPPWARKCRYLHVNGECRIINCDQCHTPEEVNQRRAQYLAQLRAEGAATVEYGAEYEEEMRRLQDFVDGKNDGEWMRHASAASVGYAPASAAPRPPTTPAPWAGLAQAPWVPAAPLPWVVPAAQAGPAVDEAEREIMALMMIMGIA